MLGGHLSAPLLSSWPQRPQPAVLLDVLSVLGPFSRATWGCRGCCSRLGSVPAVLACAAARGNPHRRALEALQSPVPLVAPLPSEAARAVRRTLSQDPTVASAAAPSSVWPFPQSTRLRFPPPLRHFLVAQQKVRRLQDCSVSGGDPSFVCLSLRAARSSFSQVWVICCWTPCWAEGRGRLVLGRGCTSPLRGPEPLTFFLLQISRAPPSFLFPFAPLSECVPSRLVLAQLPGVRAAP